MDILSSALSGDTHSLEQTARLILSTATSDSSSVSVNYLIPLLLLASQSPAVSDLEHLTDLNSPFSSYRLLRLQTGSLQPRRHAGYELGCGLLGLQRTICWLRSPRSLLRCSRSDHGQTPFNQARPTCARIYVKNVEIGFYYLIPKNSLQN